MQLNIGGQLPFGTKVHNFVSDSGEEMAKHVTEFIAKHNVLAIDFHYDTCGDGACVYNNHCVYIVYTERAK